jgi:transcriptional regulator with XRE-family HTH domain
MFYPEIKSLRLRSHFKQEYVAYLLNISQPQYSKLENGFRMPNAVEVSRLSELYNVTSDQLLSREPHHDYAVRPMRKPSEGASPEVIEQLLEQNKLFYNKLHEANKRSEELMERLMSVIMTKPI